MSTLERINDRLPRIYRNWDKDSLFTLLLESIGQQLNEAENGITHLMQAHWVDAAKGEELEKLGIIVKSERISGETDEHLRKRLKRAVDEFKGGGTVSVILSQISDLLNAEAGEVEIIENPFAEGSAEFSVVANDTWMLSSDSIKDEQPTISLIVEDQGEVSNPMITNVETGKSITYNGKLKTGEKLVIVNNRALLGGRDVTENISPKEVPQLPRKRSLWKYSEALLEHIATFDEARFDEHIFAVGIPTVLVRFDWTRQQPATFMVQIKRRAFFDSGISEFYLEKTVNSIKASGVKATIKVTE